MARSVTLSTIVDRARILADMRHSNFISPANAIEFCNIVYPELYDLLVSSFQNYYVKSPDQTITVVPGTSAYALPTDYYKSISFDQDAGGGTYSAIHLFNENERNSILGMSPANLPSASIRHRYIPAPTTFTALSESVDGVAGWDQLLTYDLAIMFLQAEESDTTALERKRAAIVKRVTDMSQNRDVSIPGRITDVTVYDNWTTGDVLRYRLYGNNVEFINVTYIGI